jgi:hypothetical protein
MKLLLLILSVMTWTVKDKNTVTGDGAYPYSIEANYSCTNTKGTVRANDEAVLTLTNMGGITVEQVEVYVRSNKTGGAGQFTVSVNGRNEATKSGSLKDWVGAYDNTNYHAVKLLSKTYANANELEITLVGTANSLYIEKYVITWSPAQPHTVTLMNGIDTYATVSETDGGGGQLPAVGALRRDGEARGAPRPHEDEDLAASARDLSKRHLGSIAHRAAPLRSRP